MFGPECNNGDVISLIGTKPAFQHGDVETLVSHKDV